MTPRRKGRLRPVVIGAATVLLVLAIRASLAPRQVAPMPVVDVRATTWVTAFTGLAPLTRDLAAFRPVGVAFDDLGVLYVADPGGHRVLDVAEQPELLAGGRAGLQDGRGASAAFDGPRAITAGPDGTVDVVDGPGGAGAVLLREVSTDGHVRTVAGGPRGLADGPGAAARFGDVPTLGRRLDGSVVLADPEHDRVRIVDRAGRVATYAGNGAFGLGATGHPFPRPNAVAVARDGTLFVADATGIVRALYRDGTVQDLAGGFDGVTAMAALAGDRPITTTPVLVIADARGIHRLDLGLRRYELAGGGPPGAPPTGPGDHVTLHTPSIALARNGTVYAADPAHHLILMVEPREIGPSPAPSGR